LGLPGFKLPIPVSNQALTGSAEFDFISVPFEGIFMYAVLETGGKQYRVAAGDRLEIERLAVEAGKPVTFDRVLFVNNDGKVTVGSPTVAKASVVADVLEHIRGEKKLTFKMHRRKGYHKSIGHRQELTVVKITEIKA
jgi:large subunit ribosomal protein L21